MHMQLRFARSLAPRSMASGEDVDAFLDALVEQEKEARAEDQPLAEEDATAKTAPPPAAPAADATAAADESSSGKSKKVGAKTKKTIASKAGGW